MGVPGSCRSLGRAATCLPQTCGRSAAQLKPRVPTQLHRSFANSRELEPREEAKPMQQQMRLGTLGRSSIFNQTSQPTSTSRTPAARREDPEKQALKRNPANMAPVIDPQPQARQQFERKKIIQEIRRRGRLSKVAALRRTERQYTVKSPLYRTGMKKVNALARQIAGKTIDEAIAQMEFSKKRAATWIKEHLVSAKNRATVLTGMNLGGATDVNGQPGKGRPPITIHLKDGSTHVIKDPSSIYIDQAWTNKGPYTGMFVKRARGLIQEQKRPSTSMSVLLKEEKTRIREHKERVEKRERQKVWEQLPNTPIHGQRPYYSW